MAKTENPLPLWYETNEGDPYCEDCKKMMLLNWAPGNFGVTEDEAVRPRDFRAMGRRPWAGNEVGERYMQCTGCNGQWGPDS